MRMIDLLAYIIGIIVMIIVALVWVYSLDYPAAISCPNDPNIAIPYCE